MLTFSVANIPVSHAGVGTKIKIGSDVKIGIKAFEEQNWNYLDEVYAYLHPNHQAQYLREDFKMKERQLETFYSLIDDDFVVDSLIDDEGVLLEEEQQWTTQKGNVVIKTPILYPKWADQAQHKIYENVYAVPVEITKTNGGKVTLEFYFAVAYDYWHFFWYNRPG